MAVDPFLTLNENGDVVWTEYGAARFEQASDMARQVHTTLDQWQKDAARQVTDWYLVFQDFGLVEPLYDTASTCETTEEEWDLFV